MYIVATLSYEYIGQLDARIVYVHMYADVWAVQSAIITYI